MTRQYIKFLGTLKYEGGEEINDIPAKLSRPKTVRERPQLELQLNDRRWHNVTRSDSNFDVSGEIDGTRIQATDCYVRGGEFRHWLDDRLIEGRVTVRPSKIRIIDQVPGSKVKPIAIYYLTESLLLTPNDLQILHHDGSVSVEKGDSLRFALRDDFILTLENHHRVIETDNERYVVQKELVARTDLTALSEYSPEEILPLLDDFLLLVALAEGRRCGCMSARWTLGDESVELYRLDRSLPKRKPNHSVNDLLISSEFEEFLTVAYRNLRDSTNRDMIYSALAAVTFDEQAEIITRFLRLFSALETLILIYRRNNNLEFILDSKDDRKKISSDLKKFLRQHPLLKDNGFRRKMFYEGLMGIQRVPLRRAAEAMFTLGKIQVGDLWPLFDTSGGWSLSTLRNRLVHGEHFSDHEQLSYIAEAVISLETITTRVLLTALGWNYRRSRVTWADWKHRDWRAAREALSHRSEPKEE